MPVSIVRSERACGKRALAAAFVLAAAAILTGCASTIADYMPTAVGGLPNEAPKRPENPPAFPPVNDVPAPRAGADRMLTAQEQKKLEADLMAARARAAAATATATAAAAADADATGSTRKP